MLVIVTDNQLLSPHQVCQDCLMASQEGLPRWHHGKLGCGTQSHPQSDVCGSQSTARLYRCQMGFQVANVD